MIPSVFAPRALDIVKTMFNEYLETREKEVIDFQNDETIQFGWSLLLIKDVNSRLEVQGPVPGEMPMRFVPDCSHSLNLMAKQRYICDSFKQQIELCNARQSAIVVKDLASCKHIFMNRAEGENGGASGWFIGAKDSQADSENADDFELKSLWEISCLYPQTIEFFLLPENWQVLLAESPIVLNDYKPAEWLEDSYFDQKFAPQKPESNQDRIATTTELNPIASGKRTAKLLWILGAIFGVLGFLFVTEELFLGLGFFAVFAVFVALGIWFNKPADQGRNPQT